MNLRGSVYLKGTQVRLGRGDLGQFVGINTGTYAARLQPLG